MPTPPIDWRPHPDAALEAALRLTPAPELRGLLAHPAVQADPYARLRALDRLHAALPHDNAVEQAWLQHMLIGNRAEVVWQAMVDWPAPAALDLPRLLLSAQVAQIVGAHDAARQRYGVALERFPESVDVWQKAIEAGAAAVPPEDAAITLRLRHANADDAYAREKIAFTLATLLDSAAPGEAFDWACRAHELKRRRVGAWHRDGFLAGLAADRRWTPQPATASQGLRPIFIVGLPRSGTTLLSALLGAHPGVAQAGEQNLIPTLATGACRDASTVDAVRLQFCADWYRAALGDIAAGANRIVDKLPANAAHCGLILALFPDAVILHCRRHLPDTAISIWQHDFEFGCLFGDDADDLGHYAEALHAHVEHWRRLAPERVIPVNYEAVVDDPAVALAPALEALGLAWRADMADFWIRSQAISTHSESQLRRPINRSSIERWRRYLPNAQDFLARIAGAPRG